MEEVFEFFLGEDMVDSTHYLPSIERVGFNEWLRLSLNANKIIQEIDTTVLGLLDEEKKEYYLKTIAETINSLLLLLKL